MHIGILGGSFNPPHIGHLLIAQQVLDFTDIKKIWFLPAYKHTFDKPLAVFEHRLAMTKLINLPNTEVSTIEADNQLSGDTIEIVPILKKLYPKDRFTFIIGSDQLLTFHKWGDRWRELLQLLPFLVVPRAGYELKPLYKGMETLDNSLFVSTNISSSMIRARIKNNLSIENFTIAEVVKYIKIKSLYL